MKNFNQVLSLVLASTFLLPPQALGFEMMMSTPTATATGAVLHAKMHDLSPNQCGVQIIEVGKRDNVGFSPQMALLRDIYDESYPGMAAKLRSLYDYSLPYKKKYENIGDDPRERVRTEVPGLPPTLIDMESIRTQILAWIFWDIIVSISSLFPPFSGIAVGLDQIAKAYRNNKKYSRARALYTLRLMLETQNQSLSSLVDPAEVEQLISVGSNFGPAGLLLTEKYQNVVFKYKMDQRRKYRTQNYAKVLQVANREGLVVEPLYRDFVIVYYDPSKPRARPLNLEFMDFQGLPEVVKAGGKKLIPLGIFGIGQTDNRVLTVDFNDDGRLRERKYTQALKDFGKTIGAAFLSLPGMLLLRLTSKGIEFTMEKQGKNVFTDLVSSEAELMALLDSGIVRLHPETVEMLQNSLDKQKVNIFTISEEQVRENRWNNQIQMANYLTQRSDELCTRMAWAREKEFRKKFLSFGEGFSRRFEMAFSGPESPKFAAKRKETILSRGIYVQARQLLELAKDTTMNLESEEVASAISTLGYLKDDDDAKLIGFFINHPQDIDVEIAALKAAAQSTSGAFAKYLNEFLKNVVPYEGIFDSDPSVKLAVQGLSNIHWQHQVNGLGDIRQANNILSKIADEDPTVIPVLLLLRSQEAEVQEKMEMDRGGDR